MKIQGKVKFFNHSRGFGFVEAGGCDYFVHITDVEGDMLLDGENVEFKSVEGHKGLQAIEITRVSPPEMVEETGEVRFFNSERGFGFIGREGKADVFAHFTDFSGVEESSDVYQGMEVVFVVRRGRDGRDRAYQIRPLT
jgi:CspA family cold shock protein